MTVLDCWEGADDRATKDAVTLIVLAVVEVVLTEVAIRSGVAGVERATTILFILVLLNFALVMAMSAAKSR